MPLAKLLFLATYFLGNGDAGVYLAVSEDGLKFHPLIEPNVPIMRPAVGPDRLTRDASLLHGPDGRWHMVWTTGWWDRGIGIAHSSDLFQWSDQKFLPVMVHEPTAVNAWAPEIVYDPDGKRYVIYWSSTIPGRYPLTDRKDGDLGKGGVPLNHRFYYTTTTDFSTYAPTRLLWDPGFNCIDANLMRWKNEWLLFGKDETKAPVPQKHLFVARGKTLGKPFEIVARRATGAYWAEGPSAVDLGDRIRVFFDRYVDDRWGAIESSDLKHWEDVSDRIEMIPHARHGTVVRVDKQVVDDLVRKLKK